jgi:tetratricopeptide (TPR) repeat protein
MIVRNFGFIGDWKNLIYVFSKDPYGQESVPYYRPLLTISFMFDAIWGGMRPFTYHLSNIIYHLVACGLSFVFFVRLGNSRIRALVMSLILAVHPVLSQAVAWIPGRNDTILAIFSLLSLLNLDAYLREGKNKFIWMHMGMFLAALLTKETAVLLPAVFVLYFLVVRTEIVIQTKLSKFILFWALPELSYAIVRWMVFGKSATLMNNVADNFTGFFNYVGKIVFPLELSVLPVPSDMNVVLGIMALLLFAALSFWGINRIWYFAFGLTWFLLLQLPTFLRITDFAHFLEHRLYLPIIGFLLMISEFKAVDLLFERKKTSAAVIILTLVILSISNARHLISFKDSLEYWKNAAMTSPSCYLAHYMLGRNYYDRRLYSEAESEILQTLVVKPEYANAHTTLGMIYQDIGRGKEAENNYKKAICLNPLIPDPYLLLGALKEESGLVSEAESLYGVAAKRAPQDAKPYLALGDLYLGANKSDKAEENYLKALDLNPGNNAALNGLGLICFGRGLMDTAETFFLKALKGDSLDAVACNNLGLVYRRTGRIDTALLFFERSRRIDSSMAVVRDNLGEAYLQKGMIFEAMQHFRTAVTMDPGSQIFLNHLAMVYFLNNQLDSASYYYRQAVNAGMPADPKVMRMLGRK